LTEPFTYDAASRYEDRMVFSEKSMDHDRNAARRFGIRGAPTFVMVDARGESSLASTSRATHEILTLR